MLTKYGTDNIAVMLMAGGVFIILAYLLNPLWLKILFGILGSILIVFTFIFFRDPDRTIPEKVQKDESYILAPADGRIVEIVREREDIFLKQDAVRISIFLSPLDVHVNRSPVSGVIKYFKYIPGDYMVAYHPKSSIKNEQTHIGVENGCGKFFFKQIVGILARRLVWDIEEGDTVKAGQKFGMMKFGSRMDIVFPLNHEIYVKTGQRVTAGEDILAKIKGRALEN